MESRLHIQEFLNKMTLKNPSQLYRPIWQVFEEKKCKNIVRNGQTDQKIIPIMFLDSILLLIVNHNHHFVKLLEISEKVGN